MLVKGDWVNDRQHVRLALTKYTNRHGERRVSVDTEGMESHTVFSLLKRYRAFSLLEADLKTGRTHQIRVHLSHLGFPIVGDDKYGDFELNKRIARGGPIIESSAPDADVSARGRSGLQTSGYEPPNDTRSAFAERLHRILEGSRCAALI